MLLNVKNILAGIIAINILAVCTFLFLGTSSQPDLGKPAIKKIETQKNEKPQFNFLYDDDAATNNVNDDVRDVQSINNAQPQQPQQPQINTPTPNVDPNVVVNPNIMSVGAGAATPTYDKYMNSMDDRDLQDLDDKIKTLNDTVELHKEYAEALNPFRVLGFYKDIEPELLNAYPRGKPWYNTVNLGLKINPSYCDYSDLYNIFNPSNVFDEMNFVGDYTPAGLPRKLVMQVMGTDIMPDVYMTMVGFKEPKYDLDLRATMFFTKRVDFHYFHEIGKQFNCAGQMYGHIPGHGVITRKDFLVGSVNAYADNYIGSNKEHCFSKNMFFPYAYRLNNETECKQFFIEINDPAYQARKTTVPIQYILKLGYGAHRASGVFLFDEKEEVRTRDEYNNGEWCGKIERSLLAQKYVGKPLTLDRNNKFDFRMYMLIASVDPIIAFYHDGFLRVSLQTYDFNSTDRNVHLTNTHLAKQTIAGVHNDTLEAEMKDYQMWTMQDLEEYLIEIGKVKEGWLDDYLRPTFKKAFIHLIRMSKHAYWKHSSVYEMFGLDFMLDEELNLWFIEANASPQLIGTSPVKEKLMVDTLTDMFHIQYAYLRSKMKRMLAVVHKVLGKMNARENFDFTSAKEEFAKANRNFLEPEFQYNKNNTWQPIIDENIGGKGAYFDLIEDDCVEDRP